MLPEIDYNADRLNRILNDKSFRKLFTGFDDFDKLKTMPKGYAKDHPYIELLKHKSFIVTHNFSDKEVADKKFMKVVAVHTKAIKPLNDFIREAIA